MVVGCDHGGWSVGRVWCGGSGGGAVARTNLVAMVVMVALGVELTVVAAVASGVDFCHRLPPPSLPPSLFFPRTLPPSLPPYP